MGKLIIISGPSGSGKNALKAELLSRRPDLIGFVGATTRKPRPGESSDDYYFVSMDEFMDMIEAGEIVEYSQAYGKCYGTTKWAIEDAMDAGDAIGILDVAGKTSLCKLYPDDVVSIYITVPNGVPQDRLTDRNDLDLRNKLARTEHRLAKKSGYDLFVENNGTIAELADKVSQFIDDFDGCD